MKDGTPENPENPQPSLEASDEEQNPAPPFKKSKGRKQLKKTTMVIDSSSDEDVSKKGNSTKKVTSKKTMPVVIDSSDDQVEKRGKLTKKVIPVSLDSDIEEIPNLMESPEEEVGEIGRAHV